MDFSQISAYVSIGITIISVILAVVNFILTAVKKKAIKNENEQLKSDIEAVQGNIKLVEQIIPNAVVFAEQSNLSGDMKELIAKSQILLNCSAANIDYNEAQVTETIKEIIELTKKVN